MSESDIVVGAVVEGVVSGIARFGAFVSLPGGKTGLVHISEVADAYVKDVRDYLKENDTVKVKVISYDGGEKIGLSIRQAQPKPAGAAAGVRRGGRGGFGRGGRKPPSSFEDRLARFMKESDEKLSDLRRHNEKRGRRGRGGEGAL